MPLLRFLGSIMSSSKTPTELNDDQVLKAHGYKLLDVENLGEGSYAKVKSAISEKLQSQVAVKIIDRKKAPVDFLQKFLPRELEILRHIKHKNIVQIYDILDMKDKVYIVMEFASHGDLLEYIKKKTCVKEEVARVLFRQLVDGARHCHNNGVLHRDLKCENILLGSGWTVKLTDFGFAKSNPKMDLCRTFCGSAAYAALEILQGIPYDGEKTDVWSMGVILYTMVTGTMPFDDSNVKTLVQQITRGVEFNRPKQPVSEECKNLIRNMLNINSDLRYSLAQVEHHPWLHGSCRKCTSSSSSSIGTQTDSGIDSEPTSQAPSRLL